MTTRQGNPLEYINDAGDILGVTTINGTTVPDGAVTFVAAGDSTNVTVAADTVTIEAVNPTATSTGGTESIVSDGTGPALGFKGLTAGAGVTLASDANSITITSTAGSGNVSASNAGEASLIIDGAGPDLTFRGIDNADDSIIVTEDTFDVTISQDPQPYGIFKQLGQELYPASTNRTGLPVVMSALSTDGTTLLATSIRILPRTTSRRVRIDFSGLLQTQGSPASTSAEFSIGLRQAQVDGGLSIISSGAIANTSVSIPVALTAFDATSIHETWIVDWPRGDALQFDIANAPGSVEVGLSEVRIQITPA